MRVGAVGEYCGGEAEVRCVECKDALDVREHKAGSFFLAAAIGEGDGFVVKDAEECVRSYDTAHGVGNKDGADRGVDYGRGGARSHFKIYYARLKPACFC